VSDGKRRTCGETGRLAAVGEIPEFLPANSGGQYVKKLAIAIALYGSLACSPVQAKTFVGVLWPMFGPLPAIGLVELVAELKMMPDVEVTTYLHQSWPSLVKDIERQPRGVHTVVIGYSLGANSTAFVANNAKYVDLIIALQPSMLSWNPPVTGRVGRMIEVYNPNPWMTFGGMGSKKLTGQNIEYVENNDSHPGAQFSSEFRNLVKTEIAKISTANDVVTAQAEIPRGPEPPKAEPVTAELGKARPGDLTAFPDILSYAEATRTQTPKRPKPEPAAEQTPKTQPGNSVAFLDGLSNSVDSGNLLIEQKLTIAGMKDYAKRTYQTSRLAGDSDDKSF
jgi:hypothetical protein